MKPNRLWLILIFIAAAATGRTAEELNLFAWSEYVPQTVIDAFTKETGIKVNYETYASGEEMLSKLLAGPSAYDLIQPPDYIAESLIKNRLLAPIDLKRVPNFRHIAPEFSHLPFDPEQKFTVPYMTGTVGIVLNSAKIKDPIHGYRDVFASAHSGRIVVVNDNREIVSWALNTLGLPINDITPANLAKAKNLLAEWLPRVKVFDSDSPKTALLNGDVDLGIVWSGEAALLFRENPKFKYVLPVEGAHLFVDVLAIPADAAHQASALKFIDFVLRPEISRLISDAFPYTNPNADARKLLTPEQLANPASYPPIGKLEMFRDIGKQASAIDKLVTDLKSAR